MIIAGLTVEMTAFQGREDEVRGEAVRAFDMSLMDGTDLGKRVWDGTADILTPTAFSALRAAISAGPVVCSGVELLGESVLCKVTITGAPRGPAFTDNRPDWTDVSLTPSLTFREQ